MPIGSSSPLNAPAQTSTGGGAGGAGGGAVAVAAAGGAAGHPKQDGDADRQQQPVERPGEDQQRGRSGTDQEEGQRGDRDEADHQQRAGAVLGAGAGGDEGDRRVGGADDTGDRRGPQHDAEDPQPDLAGRALEGVGRLVLGAEGGASGQHAEGGGGAGGTPAP